MRCKPSMVMATCWPALQWRHQARSVRRCWPICARCWVCRCNSAVAVMPRRMPWCAPSKPVACRPRRRRWRMPCACSQSTVPRAWRLKRCCCWTLTPSRENLTPWACWWTGQASLQRRLNLCSSPVRATHRPARWKLWQWRRASASARNSTPCMWHSPGRGTRWQFPALSPTARPGVAGGHA